MHILVTGGAGFIGSNLCERLLSEGYCVTALDDLSGGTKDNLADCFRSAAFRFVRFDLAADHGLAGLLAGCDAVFHLAANSDVAKGRLVTDRDLRLGTIATHNVLDAMREAGVRDVCFSSSSVVYGEPESSPTPEHFGPCLPISLYGASKLACEGLISAYSHNYGIQGWIYRFANICGRHATHGVIFDFMEKLRRDPTRLEILGDGNQSKPYLHVSECIDGMLYGWRNLRDSPVQCLNLGCEGSTSTNTVARIVIDAMGLRNVALEHTGGSRGWLGDVPRVLLDCSKFRAKGWSASLDSEAAVRQAAAEILAERTCRQLC
jgi:UDP-glucose 4-epimerase